MTGVKLQRVQRTLDKLAPAFDAQRRRADHDGQTRPSSTFCPTRNNSTVMQCRRWPLQQSNEMKRTEPMTMTIPPPRGKRATGDPVRCRSTVALRRSGSRSVRLDGLDLLGLPQSL